MAKKITKTVFLERLRIGMDEAVHRRTKNDMEQNGRFYTLDVKIPISIDEELRRDFEDRFSISDSLE